MLAVLVPACVWAVGPSWWTTRGVLNSSATAQDYAAVNQGQVKNIAKQAYEELKVRLPGGAGSTLDVIWASPAVSTNDYHAINLGQLKNVAKPFYDRLAEIDASIHYPWISSANPADDYALANIGQVKNLFSFDPEAIAAAVQPPDPLAPQLLVIASAEYTAADHATLNVQLTLADGATLASLLVNGQPGAAQTGAFSLDVAVAAGANTFVVKATDSTGRSSSAIATITRDNTPPQVAVTSPADGATIAAASPSSPAASRRARVQRSSGAAATRRSTPSTG